MDKTQLLGLIQFDRSKKIASIILGVPVILGALAVFALFFSFSSTLPSLEQLENIEPRLITKVYDKDSSLAHQFFVEKRIWKPIEEIPARIPQAVMSIEDRKFYSHWGMNLWAMPSAVLEALRGKKLRGASTLSQQLAKNLFVGSERSYIRKIKEAMAAVLIEQRYTKDEILEFYLNQVYLGGGAYGFEAASQQYFGTTLDSLTYSQSAILAGMLQRPEGLRPDKKPAAADSRRKVVLNSMYQAGFINSDELQEALDEPVIAIQNAKKKASAGYYTEEVRKHIEKKYGEEALYSEGNKIYTTLDQDIQRDTEFAVDSVIASLQENLKYRHGRYMRMPKYLKLDLDTIVAHWDSLYPIFKRDFLDPDTNGTRFPDSLRYRKLQAAAIVIENKTGAVRAMVGGLDFETSKYNRAVQATRQPGSSFKPFVYATAMDNGASPSDSVTDQPITIPDPLDTNKIWRPHNYDYKFSGEMTYRRALYLSKNLPAIQIGQRYGLHNLVNYARKFGLKSPLSAVPSLTIGSIGATLMEMTSAYTVFPNGGNRIEPYLIESVQTKNGEVLEKNMKQESIVLRPTSAYLMVNMLRDVNVRGTAAKVWAQGFHHPSGGKTGTTNDYTDAWYIGFSKHYTMGIWVGIDSHIPMGRGHTGGDAAAPIWISTMKKAHKDIPIEPFDMPAGITTATICKGTQKLATDLCSEKVSEIFTTSNKPTERVSLKDLQNSTDKPKSGNLFQSGGERKQDKKRTRKLF